MNMDWRKKREYYQKLGNLYELLGIDATATIKDINKAYRAKAFVYHPDRNSSPNAPDQFMTVKQAKDILADP